MTIFLISVLSALLVTARGCSFISFNETSFSHSDHLDLSRCHIANIPQGVFKPAPHLTSLDLRTNIIVDLTNSIFEGLESLKRLDLSENSLTSLPNEFLRFMPSLKKLSINKNPLIEISGNALSGSNLRELNIKDNTVLLTLRSRALAHMSQLTDIYIISCGITTLPGDLFEGSNTIRTINLSNNNIQELPDNIFSNKTKLHQLIINNNQLRVLSPVTFADLNNLNWLRIDNNKISEIVTGTFSSLNSLLMLFISGNGLSVVSPDAFPASLFLLNLSNNKLTTLETKLLPTLAHLELSNNSFCSVPQHWPDVLPALNLVYLNYNAFTQLTKSDMAVFSHYPGTMIYMSNNKITRIFIDERTNELPNLRLIGAPLRCDCLMQEFASLLHGKMQKVYDAHCVEPSRLNGTRLINVPLTDFVC